MKKEQDTKTTLKRSGFIADDAYFDKAHDYIKNKYMSKSD